MSKKRSLDRERLEVIMMHVLMRFRLHLMIGGVILLVASLYFTTVNPGMSLTGSLMALLMLLLFFLSNSRFLLPRWGLGSVRLAEMPKNIIFFEL